MSSFKDSVKSGMTEYLDELKEKLDGLTEAELRWQASLDTNTIVWLVWHMARVEDNWINGVIAGGDTVWDSSGWAAKTGISAEGNGYSNTMDEVRALPEVAVSDLLAYYDAVRDAAFSVIDDMSDEDVSNELDRGNGPITWGWILGHVIVEESQHLGQVALIRGIIRGLDG
ncbi:MAG: DUF664 domain-containing protein [Chloroflexi bacterium]|nr:DUF664 domain-containing protein [Chloroflexota bacterium]MBT5628165.1 DUF664 domain-containing protein [Chloroflexota bacterium]